MVKRHDVVNANLINALQPHNLRLTCAKLTSSELVMRQGFRMHVTRTFDRTSLLPIVQPIFGGSVMPQDTDGMRCKQWAVVTTIHTVNRNFELLSKLKGWCVCIVLDRGTPDSFDFKASNVVVLTVKKQQALKWHIMEHIPWNHFGRKNVGYLYAVQHGAQLIFDTDDDNYVLFEESAFTNISSRMYFQANSTVTPNGVQVFNPYPHFGFPSAWPRGFPLAKVTKWQGHVRRLREPQHQVTIVQSMAEAEPDVDAIYRLTHHLPDYGTNSSDLHYATGTFCP